MGAASLFVQAKILHMEGGVAARAVRKDQPAAVLTGNSTGSHADGGATTSVVTHECAPACLAIMHNGSGSVKVPEVT